MLRRPANQFSHRYRVSFFCEVHQTIEKGLESQVSLIKGNQWSVITTPELLAKISFACSFDRSIGLWLLSMDRKISVNFCPVIGQRYRRPFFTIREAATGLIIIYRSH